MIRAGVSGLELMIMITFDASTLRPPSLAQSFWQESGYARVGSLLHRFQLVMHAGKLWFPVLSGMTV